MNDYNDYCESMFTVPLLHVEVRNWSVKKQRLKKIYETADLPYDLTYPCGNIFTDYNNQKFSYNDSVTEILNDELQIFRNHFNLSKSLILQSWFEKAIKNNFHKVHNHGGLGYSAVCYIDYDSEEHDSTEFISPFNNFLNGSTLIHTSRVKEGSLIFFPSAINHYTTPNKSEKNRLILSFNLEVDKI